MFLLAAFITLNGLFLILTPLAVLFLIYTQNRSTNKIAQRVEEVRKSTAIAAEQAALKVAGAVLQQREEDKKDLDEKLEVIRVDVNSNLTAALQEIEDLKARLGITEDKQEGLDNQ